MAISVVGFQMLYIRAGAPTGPLRTIAVADAVALVPLAFILFAAWRRQAAKNQPGWQADAATAENDTLRSAR